LPGRPRIARSGPARGYGALDHGGPHPRHENRQRRCLGPAGPQRLRRGSARSAIRRFGCGFDVTISDICVKRSARPGRRCPAARSVSAGQRLARGETGQIRQLSGDLAPDSVRAAPRLRVVWGRVSRCDYLSRCLPAAGRQREFQRYVPPCRPAHSGEDARVASQPGQPGVEPGTASCAPAIGRVIAVAGAAAPGLARKPELAAAISAGGTAQLWA
jgi:hypothetical protein